MNLLAGVCSAFEESKPFAGRTIGVSFHIEPKTVVLLETLAAGRARWCSSQASNVSAFMAWS